MATPITMTDIYGFLGEARSRGFTHLWTAYHVGMCSLRYYLGVDWLQNHVMGTTAPTDYFQNDWRDADRKAIHMARVVRLAEMLVNLQNVPQFDVVLRKLAAGLIESAISELEVGQLLYYSKLPFRFVKEQQKKGLDYDIEFMVGDMKVCADAKCKLESTQRGVSTIVGSLGKARSQLPAECPGVIFVKTPQTWNPQGVDDSIGQVFEEAAQRFYKQGSKRIVLIEYFVSYSLNLAGKDVVVIMGKGFPNHHHRFDKSIDWGEIMNWSITPENWLNISKLSE